MKGSLKFANLILNVVSAALCIFAIVGIIAGPLMETKTTITVNQTIVDLIFGEEDGSKKDEPESGNKIARVSEINGATGEGTGEGAGEGTGEGTGGTTDGSDETMDMLKEILRNMAKDNVKISFRFSLSTGIFLRSFSAKDNSLVDELLEGMIDSAMNEDMQKEIDKVTESMMKGTTKTLVYKQFDSIRQSNPEFAALFEGKESKAVLAEVGVTEEYVDGKIDVVYDALTTDKTISEATESVTGVVKDVFKKIEDSDYGKKNPEAFNNIDENWKDLEENITKALVYISILGDGEEDIKDFDSSKVTDEMIEAKKNDVINLSDAVDKIIMNLLSGVLDSTNNNNNNNNNDNPAGYPEGFPLFSGSLAVGTKFSALIKVSDKAETEGISGEESGTSASEIESGSNGESTGNGETTETTYDRIRLLLKEKLNELISEEYKGYVLIGMKVVGGLILFFAAVWAYLLIKLVVNTLTGRMKTKMKLAYVFGWMPGLNLVVLPTVLFKVFTTSNFITQKLFTDLTVIEAVGNTLNLSFMSGGLYGFFAGVGLIIVAIVRKILKGVLADGSEN